MSLTIKAGNLYTGGFDAPFYASNSMIKSALEGAGFSSVVVMNRPDAEKIFPVNYRAIPGYDDDWDTYVTAQATTTRTFDKLPLAPAWFIESTPQGPRAVPGAVPPPADTDRGYAASIPRMPAGNPITSGSSGSGLLAAGVGLGILYVIVKAIKR